MNIIPLRSVRLLVRSALIASLALGLAGLASVASAATAGNPPDHAAQILASTGSVPIQTAGPYVQVGTYRVQVLAKLGAASATLPDGTLLYREFSVTGSRAAGTLAVRFTDGRVSELSLLSPVREAALLAPVPFTKAIMATSNGR